MIDPNLTLTGYGITLRRLTHDKIEMLRQWRNDPKIQQHMIYREFITSEMQEKWFEKINNDSNLYFIMEFKGIEVGMINLKDIDYDRLIGEGGVFIYDDSMQDKDVSYRAHLLMLDYAFKEIGLKAISSEVLLSNKRAIRFTEFLGCLMDSSKSDDIIAHFFLTKDNYFQNKNRTHFINRWNYNNKKQTL